MRRSSLPLSLPSAVLDKVGLPDGLVLRRLGLPRRLSRSVQASAQLPGRACRFKGFEPLVRHPPPLGRGLTGSAPMAAPALLARAQRCRWPAGAAAGRECRPAPRTNVPLGSGDGGGDEPRAAFRLWACRRWWAVRRSIGAEDATGLLAGRVGWRAGRPSR